MKQQYTINSYVRTYLHDHNPFAHLFPIWRVAAEKIDGAPGGTVRITFVQDHDATATSTVLSMRPDDAIAFARHVIDAAQSTRVSLDAKDAESA